MTIDARIQDDDEGLFGAVDFDPFLLAASSCGDADLSITKSDSSDPVTTGGTLTYTLTIGNAGPADASSRGEIL